MHVYQIKSLSTIFGWHFNGNKMNRLYICVNRSGSGVGTWRTVPPCWKTARKHSTSYTPVCTVRMRYSPGWPFLTKKPPQQCARGRSRCLDSGRAPIKHARATLEKKIRHVSCRRSSSNSLRMAYGGIRSITSIGMYQSVATSAAIRALVPTLRLRLRWLERLGQDKLKASSTFTVPEWKSGDGGATTEGH